MNRHPRAPRGRPTEEQLARRYREPCFLERFSSVRCTAWRPYQLAHAIPKQRLRQAGVPEEAIWDDAVLFVACSLHHHLLDGRYLKVAREALPPELEAYASHHRLTWALDREFGLRGEVVVR